MDHADQLVDEVIHKVKPDILAEDAFANAFLEEGKRSRKLLQALLA